MKTHTLILRLAIPLLIAFCLSVPTHIVLASGTSTADLKVLAEGGNPMSQRILGERLAMGTEGVTKDMSQAIFWWQKAADQGDAVAQYNLGQVYFKGARVQQDLVQAHMWFSLAASSSKETISAQQRKKLAESIRKSAEANMTPKQIEEAQALAQEWLAKHP